MEKEYQVEQERQSDIGSFNYTRDKAARILRKGGAFYKKGRTHLEVTDKQVLKAHREMEKELSARQKIINHLKKAQPGGPRLESFIHLTALFNSDRYIDNTSTLSYDAVFETITKLKEGDDNYRREYDNNFRVALDYWYRLGHRSSATEGSLNFLFAKGLKEIRDQKIAEINKERQGYSISKKVTFTL